MKGLTRGPVELQTYSCLEVLPVNVLLRKGRSLKVCFNICGARGCASRDRLVKAATLALAAMKKKLQCVPDVTGLIRVAAFAVASTAPESVLAIPIPMATSAYKGERAARAAQRAVACCATKGFGIRTREVAFLLLLARSRRLTTAELQHVHATSTLTAGDAFAVLLEQRSVLCLLARHRQTSFGNAVGVST